MKKYLWCAFSPVFFLAFAGCGRMPGTVQSKERTLSTVTSSRGEVANPEIDGDLIKVNNELCAVSRTPMDRKTLGKFTGRVVYSGRNPKYLGKTFEFNYCCAMCQKMFPTQFSQDPDGILSFHGLL